MDKNSLPYWIAAWVGPKSVSRTELPCTEDTSCEEGHHTYTWPCDYAPGTGRLAEPVAAD